MVHGRAAGTCTTLRKTKLWSAVSQPVAPSPAMTLNVHGPTLGGTKGTDATAGAKHDPRRRAIRSIVNANLKLPPQRLPCP
jgi:hypothetical protein